MDGLTTPAPTVQCSGSADAKYDPIEERSHRASRYATWVCYRNRNSKLSMTCLFGGLACLTRCTNRCYLHVLVHRLIAVKEACWWTDKEEVFCNSLKKRGKCALSRMRYYFCHHLFTQGSTYALFKQHPAAHSHSYTHSHLRAAQFTHSLHWWPLSSSTTLYCSCKKRRF